MLTPQEVSGRAFSKAAFGGYNMAMVDEFLDELTERNDIVEWAEPVKIGHNVWIGGNVVILPGVTIGDNCTIGAGSVVTRDIPSSTLSAGNPCRVIRKL